MKRVAIILPIIVAIAIVLLLSRRPEPMNVVLVVFDTCRADHLGCYGYESAETPTVDGLAADGILFERAYTQIPLTLPSHTTLFTGTYPEFHRIRDNAAYTIPPEELTLAEILRDHGYTTAAFIGAFPLDARFGLDQGFDTYDGYFPLDSERSAEKVNAAVEEWIAAQTGDGPYFVFIHYFDPHIRYLPPSPFMERFEDAPYDGEIAYTDYCLGQIREELSDLCSPDRTLWIFTSDHGEGLWEHGEQDHGIFLYDSTIRVPLIWSCPEELPAGVRTGAISGIVDILPTLLDVLGIRIPDCVQGSSLLPELRGRSQSDNPRRSHAETYFPRLRHGWSGLRSIRTEDWLFVAAPTEELYDLKRDPGQTENVIAEYPTQAVILRNQLRADLEQFGASPDESRPVAEIDPETEARLLSLGYLGRVSKTINDPALEDSLLTGPDPKDRIGSMWHLDQARRRAGARDWTAAEAELRKALLIAPQFTDCRRMLAETLAALERYGEAAGVWRGLADDYPDDALYHMFLAQSLEKAGSTSQAIEAYRETVPLVPDRSRAQAEFVAALARMGLRDDFARQRRTFLEMRPIEPETINRLGRQLLETGFRSEALALFGESIGRFPDRPDAYNLLAWELIETGSDIHRGVELARKAVELSPDETAYLDTLGWGYLKQGRNDDAVATLQQAAGGSFIPDISHHLALALIQAGRSNEAAVVLQSILNRAPGYARADELRNLLNRSQQEAIRE
ncbi:MAG: sulfatase-like hydrolase/transferase [Candidatus Eisenbacteria sp.]|nr:sulfatase-like hydrolase/transferase [Candidatus Eisenbacteria bacterium]